MVSNPLTVMGATDTATVICPGFYYLDDTDELDSVEYSRWGYPSLGSNIGQYTVHTTPPPNTAIESPFFEINQINTIVTMVWSSNGNVTFTVADSAGISLNTWNYILSNYSGATATKSGGKYMLDIWINGVSPTDNVAKEVVFSSFSYTPEGCINPTCEFQIN